MKKVRKSFRNFILSRIAKAHKDQEFLDVNLMTSEGEMISAHRFVLAASSQLITSTLLSTSNYEEDSVIVLPDFDKETLQNFVLLIYGHLNPDVVEQSQRQDILELCHLFGMQSNEKVIEDISEPFQPLTEIPKETKSKSVQPEHFATFVNNVLKCPDCPQKFTEERDLAFHQQACHLQPLTFFCGICQKTFEKETSLRHHKIAAHHAGTKIKLECDKCGGYFTGK